MRALRGRLVVRFLRSNCLARSSPELSPDSSVGAEEHTSCQPVRSCLEHVRCRSRCSSYEYHEVFPHGQAFLARNITYTTTKASWQPSPYIGFEDKLLRQEPATDTSQRRSHQLRGYGQFPPGPAAPTSITPKERRRISRRRITTLGRSACTRLSSCRQREFPTPAGCKPLRSSSTKFASRRTFARIRSRLSPFPSISASALFFATQCRPRHSNHPIFTAV